jgi:hypothetical protein
MKLFTVILVALPALTAAFAPAQPRVSFVTASVLNAKAAKSKEEDLELTRKVIADFVGITSSPAPAPAAAPAEEKKEE